MFGEDFINQLSTDLLYHEFQAKAQEHEGKPLIPRLRHDIEYVLATAGYVLKATTQIIGVPALKGSRVQYRPGVLYLDRRVLDGTQFRLDALLCDIPYLLIYQPFCHTSHTSHIPDAVQLTANALAIRGMAKHAHPNGLLAENPKASDFFAIRGLEPTKLIQLLAQKHEQRIKQAEYVLQVFDEHSNVVLSENNGTEPTFPVNPD